MQFISSFELLGDTTPIRTLTIKGSPSLPDGEYALAESYCGDLCCDCRKVMIMVHHNQRFVSLINYGWESVEFYTEWYGRHMDARTLAEMQGPNIDLSSPDLVPPVAMLDFFIEVLNDNYRQHLHTQYQRCKQALITKATMDNKKGKVTSGLGGNRLRNAPCLCGSGRKLKNCCGRGAY